MNLKQQLDALILKYETKDFIKDDPIQFPHRFKNKKDIEKFLLENLRNFLLFFKMNL